MPRRAASTAPRARRAPFALGVAACALVVSSACGDEGAGRSRGTAQHGSSQVGGAVVSTVDGHPISIADVQAVMRASSLSAREALDRLQAEQLLMAEAERRGVSGAAIEHVGVRAAVQALLDLEAEEHTPSESDLRAAYERDERFHVPETRTSIHVLARASEKATDDQVQAALRVAKKAVEDLRTMDLADLQARYTGTLDGVAVKTEQLPAVHRGSSFAKEYLSGLFSLSAPGVVPEPVRTRFGWHAIRVLDLTPARETPFEEAVTVLREEVAIKKRAEGVNALLVKLQHANPVELAADLHEKLSLVDGAEQFR